VAFVTKSQALGASRGRWTSRSIAESELRKSASAVGEFDIFLSHAYEDAEVIAGVKILIEMNGLRVYVDWMDDVQADRSRVTAKTADMLRSRMNTCSFLVFASSKASPTSVWMPWELGYFDGRHPNRVGILPITDAPGASFEGQEYLGLYPTWELIQFDEGTRIGRITGKNSAGKNLGETLRYATTRA
jgi:hypothetical protein